MFQPILSWPRALLACLLLSVAARLPAADPTPPGADLASVHAWLLEHNSSVQARELDAQSAQARAQAAGALPEPMFELELNGIDRGNPRLLPAQVDTTVYRLSQRFPLWGKRALARDIASDEAAAAGFRRDGALLEAVEAADLAWLAWWHADARGALIERLLAAMAQMRELARTRYAAGLAPQQDALRAELELTGMRRERIEQEALAAQARATLNGGLGRAPQAALSAPVGEPEIEWQGSLDGLLDALPARHPMARTEAAMASARSGMAEEVRRERWPDLGVGLGLMQMGERLEGFELMLEVEVPLQWGARRQRERAAALRADAAQAREQAVLDALRARAGQAHAMWSAAGTQERLAAQELLPQARASFESALAGYAVGAVDFDTLLQALRGTLDAERDRLDARRARLAAAIELNLLQGELP